MTQLLGHTDVMNAMMSQLLSTVLCSKLLKPRLSLIFLLSKTHLISLNAPLLFTDSKLGYISPDSWYELESRLVKILVSLCTQTGLHHLTI